MEPNGHFTLHLLSHGNTRPPVQLDQQQPSQRIQMKQFMFH